MPILHECYIATVDAPRSPALGIEIHAHETFELFVLVAGLVDVRYATCFLRTVTRTLRLKSLGRIFDHSCAMMPTKYKNAGLGS